MAPSGQKCVLLSPLLLLSLAPLLSRCSSSCGPGLSWAVRLRSGSGPAGGSLHRLAQSVAQEAGLQNRGQIGQLEGHYLLCQGPETRVDSGRTAAALDQNPHVLWHSQEQLLRRSKRSLAFNDPRYPSQWHLHNTVKDGMDINVTGVWERNITGAGVTVVVVDDGVQHTLRDIQPNYSPEGSYDLNSDDPDPMPHPDGHSDNHHGTRCAGEIAAVSNNSYCAVGVAYGGRVAGIRVLDGPLTDSMEAVAFNKHYQVNHIYSCSWGPDDDGRTVDGPHPLGKVTSDWSLQSGTGCTDGHTGTSAAAPLAAGMVALMLQVRPCLSWRDVQHIITYTATQHDTQADWRRNGAGFHHSHMYGFGLLNAWRLVNAAKVWESVPFLVSYQSPVLKANEIIPAHPKTLTHTWNVSASELGRSGMRTLEHVSVTVTILHPRRGDVEVTLVCPSGMSSLIGAKRALDVDTTGLTDWTFSTVRCWGEGAEGQYTLQITDYRDSALALGVLKYWKLTLYGSSLSPQQVNERRRVVEDAMSGQYLTSSFALPCPPGIDVPPEIVSPFTSSSLKSLLLLGCFALFWSLYYTLEVTLAHWDWRGCGGAVRGRGLQAGAIGLEDSQVVEIQPEMDTEAKVPLIAAEEHT
ncbi:proprotein convertase subtilisin/kexin type 7-like isoform X3 [Siphateles boraxobius]|uniref:proprotein convertase subtilisin/kexin type 7-like isoform X3 n=1 Tax=Siphateles boraxobius TaxID=180520 RepID=UPI004063271C